MGTDTRFQDLLRPRMILPEGRRVVKVPLIHASQIEHTIIIKGHELTIAFEMIDAGRRDGERLEAGARVGEQRYENVLLVVLVVALVKVFFVAIVSFLQPQQGARVDEPLQVVVPAEMGEVWEEGHGVGVLPRRAGPRR